MKQPSGNRSDYVASAIVFALLLVLRVLANLGYLPEDAALAPFLLDSRFSKELSEEAHAVRPYLVRTINESLSHTGL